MEYKLISKALLVLRIRFLCLPNSLPNPIQQTFQLIYIIHFVLPSDFGCYQSRSQSLTYYFQLHAENTVPKNCNNWSYPNRFVSKTIVLFEVDFSGLMTIYIHVSNLLDIYDIIFVLPRTVILARTREYHIQHRLHPYYSALFCILFIPQFLLSFFLSLSKRSQKKSTEYQDSGKSNCYNRFSQRYI